MASGLLALFDDIAMLMDDTAAMTKIAARKTAGIVGDDLAVNAEAMVGINPKRELAIVAKVAKGSVINKVILIPSALGLAAVAPALIPVCLMAGGTFLCYEAFHKTFHKHDHKDEAHKQELVDAAHDSTEATLAVENKKIKQAITTDFILSAEIVAVALGSMVAAPLATQALALVTIGIGMTVIVYGSVAGLVKLDDLGIYMMKSKSGLVRGAGAGVVKSVPYIMKGLSIVGTAAMFVVGGSIILHGIPAVGHAVEGALHALPHIPGLGMAAELLAGAVVGLATVTAWKYTGGPITRGFSAMGKILAPVKNAVAGLMPKKNNPGVTITPTPELTAPAALENGTALGNVPDVKQDMTNAAVKAPAGIAAAADPTVTGASASLHKTPRG